MTGHSESQDTGTPRAHSSGGRSGQLDQVTFNSNIPMRRSVLQSFKGSLKLYYTVFSILFTISLAASVYMTVNLNSYSFITKQ